MGDIAFINRTSEGFTLLTNSSVQSIALKVQDTTVLNENKAALIIHGDLLQSSICFSEIENDISASDGIVDIFRKIQTNIMGKYLGANISFIGCGFQGDEALILGISPADNYTIKSFPGFVTASGDSLLGLYKELLLSQTRSNNESLLFSSIWVSKILIINPNLSFQFQFTTVTKEDVKQLSADGNSELLNKGFKFHNNVRTKLSTLFLEA